MKSLLKSNKKKKLLFVFVVIGFLVGVGALAYYAMGNFKPKAQKTVTKSRPDKVVKIRLVASGDQLAHDAVNKNAKTADGYDYKQFFSEVQFVFDGADINFCNQEVPSTAKIDSEVDGYPAFNAPVEFARDLSLVGCNAINNATNHANDRSQEGINANLDNWDNLDKLAIAGTNRSKDEQQKVHYFTVKGVKFALLGYNLQSNNGNLTAYGVNMFDEALIKSQLKEAKESGALTIVSMHWGTEDSDTVDSTQEKWSQILAENGADIVLGTGPHVLQPVKKIHRANGGQTLVWYSLGNMLNTQLNDSALFCGFAVMDFEVKDKKATLSDISFLPTYMHYEWTAQQKSSQDLLARNNLKIYPLDKAEFAIGRSQSDTTAGEQQKRIETTLNKYTPVNMINSSQY